MSSSAWVSAEVVARRLATALSAPLFTLLSTPVRSLMFESVTSVSVTHAAYQHGRSGPC